MAWFKKKKGVKLQKQTDALVDKAEKQLIKEQQAERLNQTFYEMTAHHIKIGEAVMEVMEHHHKLIRVGNEIAKVAVEAKAILELEDPKKRHVIQLGVITARMKALKKNEAELLAAVEAFRKEELKIAALEEQQKKLQKSMDKIVAKVDKITDDMLKETLGLAGQTDTVLDILNESLGRI